MWPQSVVHSLADHQRLQDLFSNVGTCVNVVMFRE